MRRWIFVGVLCGLVGCGELGGGEAPDLEGQMTQDMGQDVGQDVLIVDTPTPPVEPQPPEEPPLDGVGAACEAQGVAGTCLEVQDCGAPRVSTPNLCPGPASVQCCTGASPEEPPVEPVPTEGCGAQARSGTFTVEHDGRTRSFEVHLPSGYDPDTRAPVVLNFHGRNSSVRQQKFLSSMTEQADRSGFIAVHPTGVGNTWNADLCCGTASSSNIDDVGFVSALLDELERTTCMDTRRVYATGLSNGGFLSHKLGCDLSQRITAIAPVAGTLLGSSCSPKRAVPVFHFHGRADNIVRYDGFIGFASVEDTIDTWVEKNGCAQDSQVLPGAQGQPRPQGIDCRVWSGCRDGAEVRLCSLDGVGHQWPGGPSIPGLGSNTDDLDATAEMWRFFERHSM